MKLSEIELTERQVKGLLRMLDMQALEREAMCERAAGAEQELRKEEWQAERLRELAKLTGLMHGKLPGLDVYRAAAAAWEAFCACESYFSPYNVDERFEPQAAWNDADFWGEVWEGGYVEGAESAEAPLSVEEVSERYEALRAAGVAV